MNLLIVVGIVLCVGAVCAMMHLRRRATPVAADPDWVASFSVEKYRPMDRLLCEKDYSFLAAQPGFHPSIARKLRRERRKIYRAYLRNLVQDFNRLHSAAVQMMLASPVDRSQYAGMLARQKLAFQLAVFMVRMRLAASAMGFGTVYSAHAIAVMRDVCESTRLMRQRADFASDWN